MFQVRFTLGVYMWVFTLNRVPCLKETVTFRGDDHVVTGVRTIIPDQITPSTPVLYNVTLEYRNALS
jgi:hypothetical protein